MERAATEVQLRELTPDYDQPRTGWDPVSIIGWAVIGVVYTAAVIGVVLWLR